MDGTGSFFADFVPALGAAIDSVVGRYPLDPALGYAELETVARSFLPKDRPFVLLGESFSGPIAISIAAAAPDNLVGLILCCTFARMAPPRGFRAWPSLLNWLPAVPVPMPLVDWLLLGRFSTSRFKSELRRVLRQVPPAVLRARFRAVRSVDATTTLERINVPVLYLRASEDRLVPRHASELIQAHHPPTVIREFVAPHGLLQTVPNEAAAVVRRFVSDATASARDRRRE
jgi:pimeloyl-[acyl-carrier protein] methyl ester esterase